MKNFHIKWWCILEMVCWYAQAVKHLWILTQLLDQHIEQRRRVLVDVVQGVKVFVCFLA